MGSRWLLAIAFCLLLLSGCGIGRTAVRPEIYGQFSKTGPIILDTMTGLEWQVGPDRNMNWYEAKAWVDGLVNGWRMPTGEELRGLWDAGINRNNWGPFHNTGLCIWSGEVSTSPSAYRVYFNIGRGGRVGLGSSPGARAFAVRSRVESSPSQIPEGHIFGRVESSDGAPLFGAYVMVEDTSWDTFTDSSGEYTIGIPVGTYILFAGIAGGGSSTSPTLEVLLGDEIEFNFTVDNLNPEDPKGYSLFRHRIFVYSRHPEIVPPDLFFVSEGVILDPASGLEWCVGPDQPTNWYEAKAWVESLGANWRMPSGAELRGLWEAGIKYLPYNRRGWGPFENGGWWVWSGEVYDPISAWFLDFRRGGEDWGNRDSSHFGRAFAVHSP